MNRKTMRYTFVVLGAGLLTLSSCGQQSAQDEALANRQRFTPEEWAKIEHTRQLYYSVFPEGKLTPPPGMTVEDVFLKYGDTVVYDMVKKLRERGVEIPDPVNQ